MLVTQSRFWSLLYAWDGPAWRGQRGAFLFRLTQGSLTPSWGLHAAEGLC